MRIEIRGLSELRQRLAQLRADEIIAQTLAEQAQHLAEAVQECLSEPHGAGSHDTPWVRTGALRDSISATAEGLQAAVGSNDPAAAPQEMGTSRIPPRPFLAPAAAAAGEGISHAIGQAVANAIRGETTASSNSAPQRLP
jgi:phage gpG-like protein